MKKSEIYDLAIAAVINNGMGMDTKINVLEQLFADRNLAKFTEEREEAVKDESV